VGGGKQLNNYWYHS